jgi:ABC-type ATPase involved in cell division
MRKVVHAVSDIERTPRVAQVESMFDVPPSKQATRRWDVEIPLEDEDWNIGLIVGPSGSGKTTIAREVFGAERVIRELEWPARKALVDVFPSGVSIKDVVRMLTAVGLSTPRSWLQPYSTLSTGEQFRATLARAIAETKQDDFFVIDEFTSTVDRQVAKVGSHAVQKAIRRSGGKMIALSCHNDIVDWLDPDWIYQPHTGKFTRRCLRQSRPPIELRIHKVDRSVWPLFRDHHYLNTELATSAQCYGVFVEDEIVAFGSYLNFPGPKPARKGHRFVILPDWQGLGIMRELGEWMGEMLFEQGIEWRATFAHPAMITAYLNNPRWRLVRAPKPNAQLSKARARGKVDKTLHARTTNPRSLAVYSFLYVPKSRGRARATVTA